MLHVHGFADYFFHTEYARWWADRGYTFYALDLRKYGRSLREHQTPHYVADLGEYFAEIDLAWWRITQRDGHRDVIASGHSTGGLTVPLWAQRAATGRADGDGAQLPVVRHAGRRVAAQPRDAAGDRAARHQPADAGDPAPDQQRLRPLPAPRARRRVGLRPRPGSRWSPARSTSAGCAPYDAATPCCTPGSTSTCPTLVLSSARSCFGEQTEETAATHDIVLDVEQIRRWASSVGTPRHLDRRRGRDPRRRPVPARGARARRTTPSARGSRLGGAGRPRRGVRRAGRRARPRRPRRSRRGAAPAGAGDRRWRRSGRRRPSRARSGRRRPSRCRRRR